MSIAGIGNTNAAGRAYQGEDAVVKGYTYKDGKGQETTYHLKDCLQLSMDSYSIPIGSDTYEEIKNLIKKQNSDYILSPGNKMFYESSEIMRDFYNGKLDRDEVKNIFKEYFYHSMNLLPNGTLQVSESFKKQTATRSLAGLYEHFSRANTRNACAANSREGRELLESNGMSTSGFCYYNADWYWACEEMQELFRETANELADEYGTEHVDFDYVEKNTKFTLDGGITYNGVWNWVMWQRDAENNSEGKYIDDGMIPPRGFLYCSCDAPGSDKAPSETSTMADKIKKAVAETDKNRKYVSRMFLLAISNNADTKQSLLFNKKNYHSFGDNIEEGLHQKAMEFLKNFHINYRNNRMEFLRMGE